MSSIIISLALVVLSLGGVLFGMFLRSRLPEDHLSPDAKDSRRWRWASSRRSARWC